MKRKEEINILNQCILVGVLNNSPTLEELPDGRKRTTIELSIKRNIGNMADGNKESDEFQITLWSGIAENTVEYCKAGSTIGIKARLIDKEHICVNGEVVKFPEILAEKITFINTNGDKYDS